MTIILDNIDTEILEKLETQATFHSSNLTELRIFEVGLSNQKFLPPLQFDSSTKII